MKINKNGLLNAMNSIARNHENKKKQKKYCSHGWEIGCGYCEECK
jgi:hypothetical protein